MTYKFDSIAEKESAPTIASLGGKPCNKFTPLLPETYRDADGVLLRGKPDFLIQRSTCFTFVDTKSGVLNWHRTRESSVAALRKAYQDVFHRCGDHLDHSQLSKALYDHSMHSRLLAGQHAWNHSVFKLLALQAQHGWQRFVVVFAKNPSKKDALRYLQAGLVFCTVKTLRDLMASIELTQHGWFIPFMFKARGYSFSISVDPATKALTSQEVYAHDQAKYLAAVATDEKAEWALHAVEATAIPNKIQPF